MVKLIKMVAEKIFKSRLLRRSLLQRPKPLLTFRPRSEIKIFTVYRAINPLFSWMNTPKKRSLTKISPGFRSLDPSFSNAPKTPRLLTGLERTIRIIGMIKKTIMIVGLAA